MRLTHLLAHLPTAFCMEQVALLPMLDELCVLGLTGVQLLHALENGS